MTVTNDACAKSTQALPPGLCGGRDTAPRFSHRAQALEPVVTGHRLLFLVKPRNTARVAGQLSVLDTAFIAETHRRF